MLPSSLSFVDLETTGGSVTYDRIIEVGILRIEDNKLTKSFNTLVNPDKSLDPFIINFTGITPADLEKAPSFYDIKDEVLQILEGSVFVAHNVRFDYGFLRNEFKRHDISFSAKHFCTIKLARTLFPDLRKYNLDSIIENFRIRYKRRHRAYDDAKVLWDFYKKAKRAVKKDKFIAAINIALQRPSVPLNIREKELDNLPETSGVYIFYGSDGAPLYVGKSVNIKDRVLSHFSNAHLSGVEMKISQQINSIETIKTAGELGALFLESTLIKKIQPLYNRKLRWTKKLIAVKKITDKDGFDSIFFCHLDEISVNTLDSVIGIFKSLKQAKSVLLKLADSYSLCHKLLGLEKTKKYCFAYHLGKCRGACKGKERNLTYNLRFDEAFYKLKIKSWPFSGPIIIKEKGETEESFIIDKWCYLGSLPKNMAVGSASKYQYVFDYDAYKILVRFLNNVKNFRKVKTLPQGLNFS